MVPHEHHREARRAPPGGHERGDFGCDLATELLGQRHPVDDDGLARCALHFGGASAGAARSITEAAGDRER